MVLVAVLVALVAAIAVAARRRRSRRSAPAPVAVPAGDTPAGPEASAGDDERSLWPDPVLPTAAALVPQALRTREELQVQEEASPDVPARRSEGWRGRVPFAQPLSARLEPGGGPTTPAELVARFDTVAAPTATGEVVATLAALGYAVRWRRATELALGSDDGHVARVLVESRPEGGTTVGVELEPDEVADVAVGLLDRLLATGYRLDRREATTVVLRDDTGAAVRVTRVPTLRA